ncbi:MAG TPA: GMC family oxidoreductase, partial [Candidatus Binataceae bacterium]|nr:GMC family oxidoreductase [Candidatus Binataceae bacterium]
SRANLNILDRALTDRLLIRGARVEAIRVIRDGGEEVIEAGRVVLAAGAYGTPAILLRSGVGASDELRALSIKPVLDLPGVGRNLHDHPASRVVFAGTPELVASMEEFARRHWTPEEQTIAKARSTQCRTGFDVHIYPVGGLYGGALAGSSHGWNWSLEVACMTPRSRGVLKLASPDPASAPVLDHGYLTDTAAEDLRVLVDGIELALQLGASPGLARLLGDPIRPAAGARSRAQLAEYIRANVAHYAHPVGTCAMGRANEPGAVVSARGKVHGLDNCYVGDASIMPVIPRANTNLPALAVGLRIASWLLEA